MGERKVHSAVPRVLTADSEAGRETSVVSRYGRCPVGSVAVTSARGAGTSNTFSPPEKSATSERKSSPCRIAPAAPEPSVSWERRNPRSMRTRRGGSA
ncbi:hypothetical protein ACF1HJ_03680 [Streptomyces sp. NPDC013978]|uniref:hypothetical protein n=1 Tax=Streptomyces sp. NPDC013978 TaxID=3364869 RepID=UPI0037024BAE